MTAYVLVYGNPVDGLRFIGPITPNDPALEEYIDRELHGMDWWYAPMSTLPPNPSDLKLAAIHEELHEVHRELVTAEVKDLAQLNYRVKRVLEAAKDEDFEEYVKDRAEEIKGVIRTKLGIPDVTPMNDDRGGT